MAHPIRSWWKHLTQIHETVDFADQEATSVLDIEGLFKSVLTGGMFLGVAFCLWQDVQDDFERRRVLNGMEAFTNLPLITHKKIEVWRNGKIF